MTHIAPQPAFHKVDPQNPAADHFSHRPRPTCQPLDGPLFDPRFHRLVDHLHRLGVRPLGELLLQLVGTQDDARTALVVLLERYRQLDVDVVAAVDGDRWPETIFPVRPGGGRKRAEAAKPAPAGASVDDGAPFNDPLPWGAP